jgi:hypothetical protein
MVHHQINQHQPKQKSPAGTMGCSPHMKILRSGRFSGAPWADWTWSSKWIFSETDAGGF